MASLVGQLKTYSITVAFLLVLQATKAAVAASPYPDSSAITVISFNWATHQEMAPGSDNWPVTWADNGHQYSSWGDGGGFGGTNSDGRVSLGFARIEGAKSSYAGYNVWGGKNPENPATFDGKCYGIICINGVLYAWRGPGSGTTSYDEARLYKSTNYAASWSATSVEFVKADDIIMPTILNFGQDYAGARDNYVYHYFIDLVGNPSSLGVHIPGKIYLLRVDKSNIEDESYYEFFSGTAGSPSWSSSIASRTPVFEDPAGVGWNLSVSYNAPLGRYILCTEHTQTFQGRLGMFDAPEPWGPWTTVMYTENFHTGAGDESFFWNFSNKWLSPDGKDFVLVFTGISGDDSWNTVEGTFTANTTLAASINAPADDSDEWYGEPVTFIGSASGGTPPYSYSWSSDVDGALGTGATLVVSDLGVHRVASSVEPHTITLTVEDDDSNVDADQIDLTVLFRGDNEPDGDIDLKDYAVFADDWLYSVESTEGPTPNSAWWKFDEESGASTTDSSANNNTGTLYNMSDPWVAGKFGNALDFDGYDDYVQVADHSSIEFGTGSFSISFWIKKDAFTTDSHILINGSSAGTGNRYEIANTNSYGDGDPTPSGAIVFVIDDNDAAGNKKVLTSDTTFITGDWVHCVCIRNASNQQLYIYRNGVLDDDKPGHALNINSTGEPLYIAQNEDGGARFEGQLDDIRFYNYVLSADDIDDLYNAGPGLAVTPANFNDDEIVDFRDLKIFLDDWLKEGY